MFCCPKRLVEQSELKLTIKCTIHNLPYLMLEIEFALYWGQMLHYNDVAKFCTRAPPTLVNETKTVAKVFTLTKSR